MPAREQARPARGVAAAAAPGLDDRSLLEALVRIPSVTGHEAEAVRFMQHQARADGLRVREDSAGNFIAAAGRGERLLLFVGHIDTVPGEIPVHVEDGELWGRGSVDAKGSLAAAYSAARRHRDDPDLRILVVGAVDEEGASRGARMLELDKEPDWIINGEPSGSHGITLGYKGILRGSFRASSPAMHGAHAGMNAADLAVAWWSDVRQRLAAGDGFDDVQARLDAITTADSKEGVTATGRFQLRLPPCMPPEDAAAALRDAAGPLGVSVDIGEALPAAVSGRRNDLVAAFSTAIRGQGAQPRLQRKTGTSDFNILHARYPDVPIVAYGPGDAALDHTAHERLGLDEFGWAVDVLDAVMATLAAGDAPPQA